MPNIVDLGISLGSQDTGKALDQGIGTLISGVKIAMIASFAGLLLTVLNSGIFLRISKSRLEARKNDFYTFIQTELMPVVNQDFNSTLSTLQRNLFEFNREFSANFSKLNSEFSSNLSQLTGFFRDSIEAIRAQKELLDLINKTKVSQIVEYNLQVLEQIDTSFDKLDQFNRYLGNLTSLVENSGELVNKTNELLSRTENFKHIAERIESNLSQSQKLLQFLSEHFGQLEEYKQHTRKAVADTGHSISEVFKELKELVQNTSDSVEKFTVNEFNLLRDVLRSSRNGLNHLNHLPTIETKISEFKTESLTQQQQIKELHQTLNALLTNTKEIIELLRQIQSESVFKKNRCAIYQGKHEKGMKTKELGFFWPSFTDLMVSLFFIMMVLYILTYLKLSNERRVTEEQLKKIVEIQNAIKALPSEYFDYSEEHKNIS